MIVYAITHCVTGKRYIGMTEGRLSRRWTEHKHAAKGGVRTVLYSAIRKYGPKAFVVEELAAVLPGLDRKALGEVERIVIAQEGTIIPKGYNMTPGGDGLPSGSANPNTGRKHSAQDVANMKASWTPERRAKMADLRRSRNVVMNQSPEHKAKLKAAWARAPERRAQSAEIITAVNKRPERKAAMAAVLQRTRQALTESRRQANG